MSRFLVTIRKALVAGAAAAVAYLLGEVGLPVQAEGVEPFVSAAVGLVTAWTVWRVPNAVGPERGMDGTTGGRGERRAGEPGSRRDGDWATGGRQEEAARWIGPDDVAV